MNELADRAYCFVEVIAQAIPSTGNALHPTIVDVARKIAADIRLDRDGTSRSGIPLTRKAPCPPASH